VPDVQHEPRDPEALRRRLYEPDASQEDFAAYERALRADGRAEPGPADHAPGPHEQDDPEPDHHEPDGPTGSDQEVAAAPDAPRRGRRILPVLSAVAGVLAAVLIGGAIATGALGPHLVAPPSTAPTDSRWTTLATRDPGDSIVSRPIVEDRGGRAHAEGDAVVFGPGLLRYTAARGDTVTAVARRFGLCRADVLLALPYGFIGSTLPAGSVLQLEHRAAADAPTAATSRTC
jgi:hypothetical protein